jgi:hypothetical protein
VISLRTLSNSRGVALALILGLLCAPSLGAGAAQQGGTISLSTDPTGAAVFLDGQPKGVTPLSIPGVPAGEHRVRVVKNGFLEQMRVVSVTAGGREDVALRMTQGAAASPAPEAQPGGEGWTTKKKAIVGGGVAAAILGIVLIAGGGDSEPDNAAPTPGTISISPSGLGIAGITNYGFTAQGSTDPENAPLTYAWNFGDGATGSGPTANHIFANGGNFTITLNVSDGTSSATATTTLTVADMNGTWVSIKGQPGTGGAGIERRIRFEQSGANLGGTYRISVSPGNTGRVTGRLSPPRRIEFEAVLKDPNTGQQLGFEYFLGEIGSDVTTFTGFGRGYLLTNTSLPFARSTE